MKRSMIGRAVALGLVAGAAQGVLVADFDSGTKPNNVQCDFGAWSRDPEDPTQYAREEFDAAHTRSGQGFCLRLSYDVDSPHAAYGGLWMKLGRLDASRLRHLVFWARGDERKGCTARLKIELKGDDERGACYVDGVTTAWKRFAVELDEFNLRSHAALTDVVVVFEDHSSMPPEGVLYLDDISFE